MRLGKVDPTNHVFVEFNLLYGLGQLGLSWTLDDIRNLTPYEADVLSLIVTEKIRELNKKSGKKPNTNTVDRWEEV